MFHHTDETRLSSQFTYERKKHDGIPKWRFHDTRHTWATKLLQRGIDAYTVMELGGWRKPEMVTRYLLTTYEKKREAISKLEYD